MGKTHETYVQSAAKGIIFNTYSFVPVASLRRRDLGGSPDGYRAFFDFHDNRAFLGCVTRSGSVDVGRILAFIEDEIIALWWRPHPKDHFTTGAFEQLKDEIWVGMSSQIPLEPVSSGGGATA